MKKVLGFLLVALLLVSCFKDDETKPTYTARGVVVLDQDAELGYKIELDNWQCVIPQSSDVEYEAQDLDRIIVILEYPNVDETYKDIAEVKVLDYAKYLISDVLTYKDTVAVDTLGSDPIGVYDGYVYQTDKYLNIAYSYQYSSQVHTVNLVYYPDSLGDNGEVFLKLQHNANEDSKEYTFSDGYKVFDMTSVAPFADVADSVAYVIHVNSGTFSQAVSRFEGYYYKPEVLKAKR